jgi:glucose/arabinose dehydrogenase
MPSRRLFSYLFFWTCPIFAFAQCAPPTVPGVRICQPSSGATIYASTTSATATIEASATPSSGKIAAVRIYVDNTAVKTVNGPVILTSGLTFRNGQHHLVVNAWDTSGRLYQASQFFITNSAAPPPSDCKPAATSALGAQICWPTANSFQAQTTTFYLGFNMGAGQSSVNLSTFMDSKLVWSVRVLGNSTGLSWASTPPLPTGAGHHTFSLIASPNSGPTYSASVGFNSYYDGQCVGGSCHPGLVVMPFNGQSVVGPFALKSQVSGNPVAVVASRAYLDDKVVGSSTNGTLSNMVAAVTGTHRLVVQAWDSSGNLYKWFGNVNVVTGPVPGPATDAQLVTEVVAENLVTPWSMQFAPDGRLFFTETAGRVRVIVNGVLVAQPVFDVSADVAPGQGGLTGMALDQSFGLGGGNGNMMFIHYCVKTMKCRVVRLSVTGNVGTLEQVLLEYPVANFDHTGGRLEQGPDRALYLTTGDHDQQASAQDKASWDGKILRLSAFGAAWPFNPFPENPYVYTYGHRDPQGLAWDSSGVLYETEHGPTGYDEVNVIEDGGNYGWPNCVGACKNAAYVDPIKFFPPPSLPPSGATFYYGSVIPGWDGTFLFAVLGLSQSANTHHIHQLRFNQPGGGVVTFEQVLFQNQFGRIRDVIEGPDGYVYFSTSNRNGQLSTPAPNDDRIIRIKPR